MKIVLAGQLDRVYSNALARRAIDAEGSSSEASDGAGLEKDRSLTHRVATLAALSGTVVTAPDWYPGYDEDDEKPARPRGKDPRFAPGMSLTRDAWADLYDDAAGLVQAVDFLARLIHEDGGSWVASVA